MLKIEHTCFTSVTAVVPLLKQSMLGQNFNSLSVASNAFRNDSLRILKISCSSTLLALLSLAWSITSQCELSLEGSISLTFLAIRWPDGPWPSNTPQKMVSGLDPKSYYYKLNCLNCSDWNWVNIMLKKIHAQTSIMTMPSWLIPLLPCWVNKEATWFHPFLTIFPPNSFLKLEVDGSCSTGFGLKNVKQVPSRSALRMLSRQSMMIVFACQRICWGFLYSFTYQRLKLESTLIKY